MQGSPISKMGVAAPGVVFGIRRRGMLPQLTPQVAFLKNRNSGIDFSMKVSISCYITFIVPCGLSLLIDRPDGPVAVIQQTLTSSKVSME